MLKHKIKIIPIIMVIILALLVPLVSAENQPDGVMPISEGNGENTSTEVSTTSNDDSFKKNDIYLTGDKVTIDYIIDGNLFVVANEVVIDSQIGGDAFICANSITIGEKGYIFSNLFSICSNLDIKGVVYDLYTYSQNVNISGYVYRDIRVGAKNLNIFGTIGRNAYVNCNFISLGNEQDMKEGESVTLTTKGTISGDLNYVSSSEVNLPDGAVQGNINYTQSKSNTYEISNLFLSLGSIVASCIIIWLLCLWLTPKFLKNVSSLIKSKKILPVICLGIVTPIVLVIVAVILFLIGITSSIALLSLNLLFTLMLLASSIFVITINNLVCNKFKIEKNIGIFGMLIICSIVLWAITLIPYVGTIIAFITGILGLGIIIYSVIFNREKKSKEKTSK